MHIIGDIFQLCSTSFIFQVRFSYYIICLGCVCLVNTNIQISFSNNRAISCWNLGYMKKSMLWFLLSNNCGLWNILSWLLFTNIFTIYEIHRGCYKLRLNGDAYQFNVNMTFILLCLTDLTCHTCLCWSDVKLIHPSIC